MQNKEIQNEIEIGGKTRNLLFAREVKRKDSATTL